MIMRNQIFAIGEDDTILNLTEMRMTYFNQHSYTITAVSVLVVVGVLALRSGVDLRSILATGILLLLLISAFMVLNPGKSSHDRVAQIDSLIGAGQPVLIEFQSPY
jgi:hypothetical protein